MHRLMRSRPGALPSSTYDGAAEDSGIFPPLGEKVATYFFDTDDGDFPAVDDEGVDLPSDNAARLMGLRALSKMASDEITAGKRRTFTIAIRRDDGSLVYTAALNFKANWA